MSMPSIKASNTKRRQAITDIAESIALEECALAHILNAEGEAIQKVICFNNLKPEDIIDVNKSVAEVIKAVAEVEKELREKLEIIKDCLCSHNNECDKEDYSDCD
ncbi:MAG: hypothetical protein ACRDBM_07770 [Sporomusa sp.]